jgi:hypothetical protein
MLRKSRQRSARRIVRKIAPTRKIARKIAPRSNKA